MKYISTLLIFTTLSLNVYCQLNYFELMDINNLSKKEDFEAVKTFLKIKGYQIYTDNENYDHGNYFVLAEIQARMKIGERIGIYLKDMVDGNIYDKIEINFDEYDNSKELAIKQGLENNNDLNNTSYSRKFEPLLQWIDKDWDYVKAHNTYVDSEWNNGSENRINSEAYKKYFLSKKFMNSDEFEAMFKKNDIENGEKLEYHLYYEYHEFSGAILKQIDSKPFRISTSITLKTTIEKGKNISNDDKKTLTFPLIKSGSSYLIKIKFGNIIKTYLLDSGASDMTLDDEVYQYLKTTKQLKIQNNITSREYILADGSKVLYKRVQIPTFSINNVTVKNITAVLVENGKPLLLGKSFLDSFKSWKVDNKNNVLIVEIF